MKNVRWSSGCHLVWVAVLWMAGWTATYTIDQPYHHHPLTLAGSEENEGREKICQSIDIRGLSDLESLNGCTVIEGSLQLNMWMDDREISSNVTFPDLREVTGFVMAFWTKKLLTMKTLFPNLAVIRGQELVENYALIIYKMQDMQEIGLPSLTNIIRGAVWIADNENLCYVDTVDWSKIANDSNIRGILDNKQQCPDTCPQCPKSDTYNDKHLCWSKDHCQIVPEIMCPHCNGRPCYGNNNEKHCCHQQCLGGCSGPGPEHCFVCRGVVLNNVNGHDSYCMDKCPAGYYEYLHRRCLSASECLNITAIPSAVHNPNATKTGKWYTPGDGSQMCVLDCPKDTELARNGTSCIPCTGACKKSCAGRVVDSIEAARELAGCTRIAGALKIHIRKSTALSRTLAEELKENLDKIEEIDHYLAVTYTYSIYSLDFLRNLRLIRGLALDDKKYALVVKSNDNLVELWNETHVVNRTIRIENKNARVLFHYNPKLCPGKIWEFVRQASIRLPAPDDNIDIGITNGDKAPCNTKKLTVNILAQTNSTVTLRWTNFRRNLTLPNHLLNYEIHYKEKDDPKQNVSKVEGRDPCGDDGWNVQEQGKINDVSALEDEPEWESEALIANLKPYTHYALYVKAIVIPDVHSLNNNAGAESDIEDFRTLADIPNRPEHYRLATSGSDRITVTWEPPQVANGELATFKIWIKSVPEKQTLQDQRNYCEQGRAAPIQGPVSRGTDSLFGFGTTLAPFISNPDKNCCSCNAPPKISRDEKAENVYMKSNMFDIIIGNYLFPKVMSINAPAVNSTNTTTTDNPQGNEINRNQGKKTKRSVTPLSSTSVEMIDRHDVPDTFPTNEENAPNNHVIIDGDLAKLPGLENITLIEEISYNASVSKYSIVLKNLTHYTTYHVGIQACRKVDDKINTENDTRVCSEYIEDRVQTALDPRADSIDSKSVFVNITEGNRLHIRWATPTHPNGVIMAYVIVLQKVGANKEEFWDKKCITHAEFQKHGTNYTYPQLLSPGNYSVKIQVASLAQDSEFTAVQYFYIEDLNDKGIGFVMMMVLVPVVIILLVFACVGYLIIKKHYEPHSVTSANPNYMPNVEIAEEWEVPREKIKLLRSLGQGSFGAVYEGKLIDFLIGQNEVLCAVKTVADETPSEERALFLKEAALMTKLTCRHVVKLLGIVSKTQPIYVIMELMENGDLKNFLRSRRPDPENTEPPPTLKQILRIASEVADGMAYIHSQRLVHRDLAARNCLVHKDLTVKVGDFGMTKEINDYYRKLTRGLLPVRWMAPESLRDGVFTSQSDVWSFGVVLWEMATLGAQPYQGLSNSQVLDFVQSGRVMDMPDKCPPILYELMSGCWQYDHRHRPTFLDILDRLTEYLDDSFAQVSFYHSPEGEQYRSQAATQPVEEEPTVRSPLIATLEPDLDDMDDESDEDNHPLTHHIVDDLGDTSSRRLLNSNSSRPIIQPSTSPTNKATLENGVALTPLSISGNNNSSYLKNGGSSAYPTVSSFSTPSSLFSNPPLRSSLTSSQIPATTNPNNNYTQAVFTTPSSTSSGATPTLNYSIPLSTVKPSENEVIGNTNNKLSQNKPNRSPVTYTSVTPVSQNLAQTKNHSNTGSGVDSNESSKSYIVNCAGDTHKMANGTSTGGNGFILPVTANTKNKTTQF